MTKALFGKGLAKLEAKFMKENKKVILFIDNCSTYYADSSNLINIKIVCIHPNTTSVKQPLDAGIIKNTNHFYRKKILQNYLAAHGDKNILEIDFFKYTVLDKTCMGFCQYYYNTKLVPESWIPK